MTTTRAYRYFVSFALPGAFGNVEIELPTAITSISQVRQITRFIEDEHHFTGVTVLNFVPLPATD
jgi:hypothetical protein